MSLEFGKIFDQETIKALSWFDRAGLTLFLVGGAVRDFILFQKKSIDLDFEVRFKESVIDLNLLAEKFIAEFSDYKLSKLPYSVYRFDKADGHSLELSLPRKEVVINPYDHHYFDAEINTKLSLKESLVRRDFTINALALELVFSDDGKMDCKLADFYDGLNHLTQKKLTFVSDHFSFDPVRFLRAYRFQSILGFSFSGELEKELSTMPLNKLSLFYFLEEWKKAQKINFGLELISRLKLHPVDKRPEWFLFIDQAQIAKAYAPSLAPYYRDDMNNFWRTLGMLALYGDSQQLPFIQWQKYFGIKEREYKSIVYLRDSSFSFSNADFFFGEFGVNNQLLENLQNFKRHLEHISFLENFISTFYPDKFLLEREMLGLIKESEKEINTQKKDQRESFLPVWRSLWSYYLVGVNHVKK